MRFLGIDIGYDRCGICVLDFEKGSSTIVFAGSIITDKSMSFSQRLGILHEDLTAIREKFKPAYVSIEKLFFYRKNPTFEKVCMSKGVAMVIFKDSKITEVEPKKMKIWITGDGNADKRQVKQCIEQIMKLDLKNVLDDTVDAVGLALFDVEQKKIEYMQHIAIKL